MAFIVDSNQVNLSGTSGLIDQGVTEEQVSGIKYAVISYTKSIKKTVGSINITDINVIPRDRNSLSRDNFATFKVYLDKDYLGDARLTYTGLEAIRLVVSTNNKQVFDSGLVTPENHN